MTQKELEIRSQFSILYEKVYSKPLVYLDNGATTQKPNRVLEKMQYVYEHLNSNVHRGVHYLSNQCTDLLEEARRVMARHINAEEDAEVIFTRGTTESINLLAFSFGETFCKAGDEIIVTEMEHHSDIVPWQMLCQRKGMTLRVLTITDDGELEVEKLDTLINEKTKLICVAQVSNVLGTVNPIKDIISKAHARGVLVMVDGAQSVPHMKVDVQDLDCDFLVFSGHKMYGPTGSGIFYGKRQYLDQMVPYHGGGEMIDKVSFSGTTYNVIPFKFEAGTPDYVASIGLAEAARFIEEIGYEYIEAHEKVLVQYTLSQLQGHYGVNIIGNPKQRSGSVSFLIGKTHPYDVGMILDKMGVAVRTGHHCAQPLMERLGITGTVRASFGVYNTQEDIDIFVKAVRQASIMLG